MFLWPLSTIADIKENISAKKQILKSLQMFENHHVYANALVLTAPRPHGEMQPSQM